jgi:type II secretory pathway component GspD/PulD (secretin)
MVLLLLTVNTGLAQESDADAATEALQQGIAQYKAQEFKASKKTLLSVDADKLNDEQKKTLADFLSKADTAMKKKAAALSAYRDAQKALEAGEYEKARKLFSQAAQSEYLLEATRRDAKAQLAWVNTRIEQTNGAAKKAEDGGEMVTSPAREKDEDGEGTKVTDVKKTDGDEMFNAVAARKQEAKRLVAKGKAALKDNQPEKAADYFGRALKLDKYNNEAKILLERARGRIGTSGGDDLLSERQRKLRVLRGATLTDYGKYMKTAREKLATALSKDGEKLDFTAAVENARAAKKLITENKRLFSANEFRELRGKADDLIEHINKQQEKFAVQRAREQAAEIASRERQRRLQARKDRRETIAALTRKAKTLVSDRQWKEARDTMREILRIEPDNSFASEGIGWVKRYMILERQKEARQTNFYEAQRQFLDIVETETPWYELLRYPRNWREITEKRKRFSAGEMSESEKDRRTRKQLQRVIRNVDFSGIALENVLNFLRDVTGANIVPNWEVLADRNITRQTQVTAEKLSEVTGQTLLEVVLENVGGTQVQLGYVIEDGIVKISTSDALRTKVKTRVYDIRDLIIPVPDFDGPDMDIADVGGDDDDDDGGGGDDGGLFGDDDDDDDDDEVLSQAEMIENIISMIKEKAPLDSWVDQGGPGSIREFGGQLVVTQTPEVHDQILELIGMLREAKQIQVSVEARFITVSTGFLNQVGVDMDFYFNIGSGLGGGATNVDPFTGALVPTTGTNGWGMNKSRVSSITPIPVTQNTQSQASFIGSTSAVAPDIGASTTSHALSVFGTFLDDVQVDFLVQATQAHSSGRQLTAPRVTMFNGQQAYVAVGTTQAYISDLEPVTDDNAVAFDPEISTVTTGSVLEVRPTVSADRRYVTMTLTPQITTLNGFLTVEGGVAQPDPNGGGGDIGFGLSIQLPNVTITEVRTTVTVPDGGTLVLGGQKLSSEVEREKGVPMLSKVPVLNRLFTNRGRVRDENTLLILVKPKIIITREAEEIEELWQEIPRRP